MRAQKAGTIVNISSLSGVFGTPFSGLYRRRPAQPGLCGGLRALPGSAGQRRGQGPQAGGSYVEAQIYATADEVAARRAWVQVAGSDTGPTDRVASLLEGIGRVRRLGAPPAAGAMKIAVLNLFLALLPAIAASAALVQRRGLPDQAFIDVLSDDSAFPPFVGDLARRMARRDFAQPINDLRGIAKDLAVLATELSDSGLPLAATLAAPLGDLLQRAIAAGRGGDDICTLIDLLQAKKVG